jgi:hypothetical protein
LADLHQDFWPVTCFHDDDLLLLNPEPILLDDLYDFAEQDEEI